MSHNLNPTATVLEINSTVIVNGSVYNVSVDPYDGHPYFEVVTINLGGDCPDACTHLDHN